MENMELLFSSLKVEHISEVKSLPSSQIQHNA